jgi:hypothetical protein
MKPRTLSIAALSLFSLLAPTVGHASDYGAQAINYLSYQAQNRAGEIRRASQFTKMESYDFVKNFINYSGYSSLPDRLLGSKEFIARVKDVRKNGVYWSPGPSTYTVDRVLEAAQAARKSLGRKAPKQQRSRR